MKNIFFFLITITLFLVIIFGALNIFFSGVPLFSILNLSTSDAVYISKKEEDRNLNKVSFDKDHYVENCGESEGGFYNLAYKKDIFGFRTDWYGRLTGPFGDELIPGAYLSKSYAKTTNT